MIRNNYLEGAGENEIGRGIGVVFSPDLSVPDNCRFYQSLGFACFQGADWEVILDDVHRYNVLYPERRIFTLVLETHGTNGNGLKLQTSYDPAADPRAIESLLAFWIPNTFADPVSELASFSVFDKVDLAAPIGWLTD